VQKNTSWNIPKIHHFKMKNKTLRGIGARKQASKRNPLLSTFFLHDFTI
jgi:hypothetical protein